MIPPVYDLHCHSTASDGALPATELVQRAHRQGVSHLALTDHDTVASLAEAKTEADRLGIELIYGIELSTSWYNHYLHIVGLGINPYSPPLLDILDGVQTIRLQRAEKIAEKLAKKNIGGAWEFVTQAAGQGMITRSHYADFLVATGYVETQQEAFDRYLARGKPAYVATEWMGLGQAVACIRDAGGIAVIAHPLRYKLTAAWIQRLLPAFKELGGQGVEVVVSRMNMDDINMMGRYAQQYGLYASVGSDFHTPTNPWIELGRLAPLPEGVKPVWELLNCMASTKHS